MKLEENQQAKKNEETGLRDGEPHILPLVLSALYMFILIKNTRYFIGTTSQQQTITSNRTSGSLDANVSCRE